MRGPILVILVGESGAGKSTFAKAMDCDSHWFVSSKAMIEALKAEGVEPAHDAIHAFAKKAYTENPYWQIPKILVALQKTDFLVYDGPRNADEVRRLAKYPNTLVVRVLASDRTRYERLQKRDGVSWNEFLRIKRDEAKETGLSSILKMATIAIPNNGSYRELQKKAIAFKKMLERGQHEAISRRWAMGCR